MKVNREQLRELVKSKDWKAVEQADVSEITDMNSMFYSSQFNGDVSKWNVSNVINMNGMFYSSQFNGDISKWNVNKVTNMRYMFCQSKFNGDVSKWNVSNVTGFDKMFTDMDGFDKLKNGPWKHIFEMKELLSI